MGSYGKKADEIFKGIENTYVATDDFYKINYFLKELETLKLSSPDVADDILEAQAARIVQNTMPNYDRVPKGIKALKDLPLGSFVSFPAEIIRTSGNILRQASSEITSGNKVLQKRGAQRLAGFFISAAGWEIAAALLQQV
jgi:hypothetical protein